MNVLAPKAPTVPVLTIRFIQQKVADHFRLPVEAMRSKRRCTRIARPRQVAMYLASVLLPMRSLPALGRAFSRDHTTVMHAINRVGELMNKHPAFREEVLELRRSLVETADIDPTREMADQLAEDTAAAMRDALKAHAAADPRGFVASICAATGIPVRKFDETGT
ncbi:MAG TPA: helix-turn-helix domain-containing protein [Azospirillum sp.]|nr:helix-turn-helix domain-containing protein [Azospirillum sp.]